MTTITGCTLLDVRVDLIDPGPNDRKVFDQEALERLAADIASTGLTQPAKVRPLPDGRYELVAGERRWRAHGLLGAETMTCLVDGLDDELASRQMLAENLNREGLNIVEEASAYRTRMDRFGLTPGQVAEWGGVTVARVITRLPVLDLVPEAQEAASSGSLSVNHVRVMADLDHNRQRLALKALARGLHYFEFRDLCERLRGEQSAEGMTIFDPSNFLRVEEYVLDARNTRAAKGRTRLALIREMADALEAAGIESPLVEEARAALAKAA